MSVCRFAFCETYYIFACCILNFTLYPFLKCVIKNFNKNGVAVILFNSNGRRLVDHLMRITVIKHCLVMLSTVFKLNWNAVNLDFALEITYVRDFKGK